MSAYLLVLSGGMLAFASQPVDSQQAKRDREKLDEIIITARRRTETLQRVPVSVVSLSAKELEARSVTNLSSLQRFVPNVTLAPSQNVGDAASNIFIRGIGQEDFSVGSEPGVGLYVDGVYYARSFGTIMNVTDIARIEVLRGPQGTLYGKNTIGGAINLISVQPRRERERRANLIVGNLDRVELRSVWNEPLSQRLFARLSVSAVRRDGYLRRLPPPASSTLLTQANLAPVDLGREGDDRSQAARLQLRWLATDSITADLSFDGSRRRGNQGANHLDAINPAATNLARYNFLIRQGLLPGPILDSNLVTASLFESHATGRNSLRQDLWGAAAKISTTSPIGTLGLTFAYRGLHSAIKADSDGLYFDITESDAVARQRQLSGEVQLTGTRGRLTYTAGLFLFRETSNLPASNSFLNRTLFTCGCYYSPGSIPAIAAFKRRLQSSSYAAYAQATYQATDQLSASFGVRYSHERKSINGIALRFGPDFKVSDFVAGTGSNNGKWSPVTYRAGAEYQLTHDLMAYGSVARGFKSGGFNIRGNVTLPNLGFAAFKPEKALTYETGIRSEWFDRRLRLNVTLFHTDYANIQLRRQTLAPTGTITLIENAARARIRGAEVELEVKPARGLRLSAAWGLLDARYTDVGNAVGLTLGSKFQRTPRQSLTTSVDLERPVGKGAVELHASYSYRSREQFQTVAAMNDQQGYGLLDGRLTYRPRGRIWSAALFGTNLTDKHYRSAGRGTLLNESGLAYSSIGLPRQIGLQVSHRF